MVPHEIAHEIVVAAPVDRVWAIITEPEHIQAWFAFDGATIDLRPGGELVMTWKEHGTYHARIERIEPPHRFAWRWARLPGEQPRPGDSTLVEFTLTPEGDGPDCAWSRAASATSICPRPNRRSGPPITPRGGRAGSTRSRPMP